MDKNIADKIFGDTIDTEELENKYPKRNMLTGTPVTRFAPSIQIAFEFSINPQINRILKA